jgi:3-deoxy-D-manno-octulosonic acid (KDO) 8-phosphate synthase
MKKQQILQKEFQNTFDIPMIDIHEISDALKAAECRCMQIPAFGQNKFSKICSCRELEERSENYKKINL